MERSGYREKAFSVGGKAGAAYFPFDTNDDAMTAAKRCIYYDDDDLLHFDLVFRTVAAAQAYFERMRVSKLHSNLDVCDGPHYLDLPASFDSLIRCDMKHYVHGDSKSPEAQAKNPALRRVTAGENDDDDDSSVITSHVDASTVLIRFQTVTSVAGAMEAAHLVDRSLVAKGQTSSIKTLVKSESNMVAMSSHIHHRLFDAPGKAIPPFLRLVPVGLAKSNAPGRDVIVLQWEQIPEWPKPEWIQREDEAAPITLVPAGEQYIHVCDVALTLQCLSWKYNDTTARWRLSLSHVGRHGDTVNFKAFHVVQDDLIVQTLSSWNATSSLSHFTFAGDDADDDDDDNHTPSDGVAVVPKTPIGTGAMTRSRRNLDLTNADGSPVKRYPGSKDVISYSPSQSEFST